MRTRASVTESRDAGAGLISDSMAVILRYAVVFLWLGAVVAMLVTDVWDESRSLNWIADHGFFELLLTNWKPPGAGPVVLFRPLPMVLFTAVAEAVGNFELAWRLLRLLNAGMILLGLAFATSFLRRVRPTDRVRELLLTVAVLWSGSALICAGWFANVFDVCVFVLVMFGLRLLAAGDGIRAGVAFGAAFFCKENAVLVFPLLAVLLWTGTTDRKSTLRAFTVTGSLFVLFLVLRFVVVAPGSAVDLREFSVAGVLRACFRLPETLWWQVADVPIRWLGSLMTVSAFFFLRSFRAIVGGLAVLTISAVIYGEFVHLGPTPLLNPHNFIGRLYLVPAAILLLMLALFGRRWAIAVLIVPLVWGGFLSAERHIRFQRAYRAVYRVAAESDQTLLAVDCPLYRGSEHLTHRYRRVEFGHFPDANWQLRLDGSLATTPLNSPGG